MRVLIVDDDTFTLDLLQQVLSLLGHTSVQAKNAEQALEILSREDIRVVITDWDMPGMSGLDLCRTIRNDELHGYTYLIMLTGRGDTRSRRQGLSAGADDFLFKPLDADDLNVCFKTAERILALETRDAALFALAKLAESRDPETGAHVERVQTYARLLARNLAPAVRELHHINPEFIRMLYQTSALHDLGKVGIPDSILLKPGKLTPEEFEVIKTHAILGSNTLDAALQRYPNASFLRMARDIAASHHERFDGTGYPDGLTAEQIPMCARLVALADVYDALTSRRVYKQAMTHDVARQFIVASRGRSFDPDVVDAFLRAEHELVNVRASICDQDPLQQPAHSAPVPSNMNTAAPILIVEDSTTLLHSLTELLATTGRRILSATNTRDGMALFVQHHPEIVVSDWIMPGGSGLELCQQMRNKSAGQPVHFIMLTAHSDQASLLQAYEAGVSDFVAKPCNTQELLARVKAGIRMSELNHELARKSDRLLAANIDIDFFKKINDTHGHEAGDQMLRQIAIVLSESTRATDIICRVGGEEFLLIFPLQNSEDVLTCVERIRANVKKHAFKLSNGELNATVSMGVTSRNSETRQGADLLRSADRWLYEAKRLGRNRVQSQECVMPSAQVSEQLIIQSAQKHAILNIDSIIDRCSGDESFAYGMLERFRQQAPIELKQLNDALAENHYEFLGRAAHTLKSMAAYVEANVAAGLCQQLEDIARSNSSVGAAAIANDLQHEIECVLVWIAANPKPIGPLAA